MHGKLTALASAAALIFAAGVASADDAGGTPAGKVKCEGVNSCKGQGSCHSAQNECAGQNSCKGKGFKMLTPEECQQAKAKAKDLKEKQG
jgi:hypothetical protein